ncbi:MAG: 50S ribosomal protein L19 [Candidatus Scalindua rubra]|uniref:Multifunctional fusion protein n=1 Tax=Candidatus Scalindua rubra TaxID=1872076 RepID=A0A1E3XDD6_9BACT|nr:MAG: 50S ribosomal protein L19 [Candidatus Scalindua rubra]
MNIIDLVEKENMKKKVPKFQVGDLVDVHVKTFEGEKERIQIFNGIVIAKKGSGVRETFTVRRIVQGEGVERVFPLHSPNVADVKVKKSYRVRRAKLYYLREKSGKSARMKEIRRKVKRKAKKTNNVKAEKKTKNQVSPKELCIKGENLAKKFLKKKGYKILKRNYVCKSGEIDIIAYDKGVISFVEVKSRLSEDFGPPELAVTNEKRSKIIRTALNYLMANQIEDMDYRFDIVSILFKENDNNPDIELLKNAFTADGVFN